MTNRQRLQPFLDHLASLEDLTVELVPERFFYLGGLPCGGVFGEDDMTIRVATKRPFQVWAGTLVHEYCHYLQQQEQTDEWRSLTLSDGTDLCSIINYWLCGHVELTPEHRAHYLRAAAALELDCERRALGVIADWRLGLNKHTYAAMANAYVLSHEVALEHRVWIRPGSFTRHLTTLKSFFPDHLHAFECYHDRKRWREASDFLRTVCMGPVASG